MIIILLYQLVINSKFVLHKNCGGLIFVSGNVFKIVKECGSHGILIVTDLKSVKYSKIILKVQRNIVESKSVFKYLNCDGTQFDNHVLILI